jgi:hypothetical protein
LSTPTDLVTVGQLAPVPQSRRIRARQILNERMMPRMMEIREKVEVGMAMYDADTWAGVLDWLEEDLAKEILYGAGVPEDQRGTKSPFYKYFEMMSYGRSSDQLETPSFVCKILLLWFEFGKMEEDARKFLGVKYVDVPAVLDAEGPEDYEPEAPEPAPTAPDALAAPPVQPNSNASPENPPDAAL